MLIHIASLCLVLRVRWFGDSAGKACHVLNSQAFSADHGAALLRSGQVFLWGSNRYGQCLGRTPERSKPSKFFKIHFDAIENIFFFLKKTWKAWPGALREGRLEAWEA